MSTFLLITIVLSSLMIVSLLALYLRYWKDFRVIVKSTINELLGKRSKSALISFISFSIFFGFIFTVVFTSYSSNSYYEDVLYDYYIDYNTSSLVIEAGDLTTESFIGNDPTNSKIIDSSSNNAKNESNNDAITYDKASNEYTWTSGKTGGDLINRDVLEKSDRCNSLINEDPSVYDPSIMEPFSNSSPFYSIGSTTNDKTITSTTKGLQNSYLYCVDYSLAEIQKDYLNSKNSFTYSFSANSTFTGYSIKNSNSNFSEQQVRIVSLPSSNSRNSNDGVIVNQPITSDEYKELQDNEAYILDYNHSSNSLNEIKNGDSIILDTYSSELNIVDSVYSMQYIKAANYQDDNPLMRVPVDNWIDTDNMIVFVNEETLFNILKENYYNNNPTITNSEWDERTYNTSSSNIFSSNSVANNSIVKYKFYISMDRFVEREYLSENNINSYSELYNFVDKDLNKSLESISSLLFTNGISFRGSSTYGFIPGSSKNQGSDINEADIVQTITHSNNNDNFLYTKDSILISRNSVNIFGIFILLIGIIVIGFLISRSFRNDVTWMGNLKALGYSQSTISLLLVTKIIIYLLLGFVFTLILTPIMNILWMNISTLTISLPYFYVSIQSFVFTILFPFLIFISFAFLISRFFFISKNTLSLVNDEVLSKPNILIRKLDTADNISFTRSYSAKNSIRNASKSAAILISSVSICVFILLSFSVSDTLDRTVDNISESYSMNDVTLLKSSSNNKKTSVMSNEEFQNGINNGTITDYTFGLDEISVPKLLTEASSATGGSYSCDVLYGTMYQYVEDTPISNTYISNQTLIYLNEVLNAYPESLDSCSTTVPTYGPYKSQRILENFLTFIRINFDDANIHYLDHYLKQYPSSLGISLGANVVDKTHQISTYNLPSGVLLGDEKISTSWITFVENFEDISNIFELSTKESNVVSDYDNSTKDGKIEFFTNESIMSDGKTKTHDLLSMYSDDYGEYVLWTVPTNFYNSSLSSTLKDEEREIKIYYGGSVNVPFVSQVFLAYSDPDWTDVLKNSITTDKSIADNNVFVESEFATSLNISFLTNTNPKDINVNRGNSLNNKIEITTSNSNIDKIRDTINRVLLEIANGLGASSIDLGDPLAKSFSLDFSSAADDSKLEGLNRMYYSNTITMYDIFSQSNITSSIRRDRTLKFLDKEYLLENIGYIDSLLDTQDLYFSGLTLNIADVFIDLSTPSVEPIQLAIYPLSIMATLTSLSLIFILVNEIIKDNKNNTNSLKTIGHSSSKTTFITYFFYPVILLTGFLISVPLVIGVGTLITSVVPPALSMAPILFVPSTIQFVYTFAIIVGVMIIIYLISQFMTSNLRPQLSIYRN